MAVGFHLNAARIGFGTYSEEMTGVVCMPFGQPPSA